MHGSRGGRRVKILLVDDHALFRAGMRMLLKALGGEIVLEAGDERQALDLIRAHRDIKLCLLDLSLRNGDGLGLLDEIKQLSPNTAVVVVSAAEDNQTIRRCIDAGAMSFIPKSAAPEVLTEALQRVLADEIYLPEMEPDKSESDARPTLTPRQRDVLKHLSQGLPTKLIARELGLSEYTIKEHIASIFQTLRVRNRTEAVIRASRLMLLSAS
jgi:DNA-binding NarL/FixJ family response regulator